MNYDDLETLAVSTMISNEILNMKEPYEYLSIMRNDMARALANAIIDNDIGEIEERYDVERMGKVYTFQLRYLPTNKP